MRVAIYLRVSTTDQTTDNQRRELEAVASRHNWSVVRVFLGGQGSRRTPRPRRLDEGRFPPRLRYGAGLVG
jgi:DNA invertase Pin-like site-specific DNA recombinase